VRVFVTGGAGYIGSHACKALAKAGHEPIVYDDLSTGHSGAVRWGPLVVGDIRDAAALDAAFADSAPDMVMHFAALAYVGESVVDPARYYDTNVTGTLSLPRAMVQNGVKSIVFSSSCATYGSPLILGMHDQAGHFLKSLAEADAPLKVAVLAAASFFMLTGQARLAPGIDALVGPTAGLADTVALSNAGAWLARRLPTTLGDHPSKMAATEKPTLSVGAYDPKRMFASSPALAVEHVFVSWVDPYTAALLEDAASYAKARGTLAAA
jgi:NAD(P)-dependent dehydrogenase (short-subunit alcohol dehydrogenase family)